MSDKLHIEDLFNRKLEGAELEPSPKTWKTIQRQVRRKQFLRFHPRQFNVYYAGALLLSSAALVIGLTGRPDNEISENDQVQELLQAERQEEGGRAIDIAIQQGRETGAGESGDGQDRKANRDPEGQARQGSSDQKAERRGVSRDKQNRESEQKDQYLQRPARDIPAVLPDPEPGKLETITDGPGLSEAPRTAFSASLLSGCAPLEVQFSNQTEDAESYRWDLGTGEILRQRDISYTFSEPGVYTVVLRAQDARGKAGLARQTIEVLPRPVADFGIEEGFAGMDHHVVLNLMNYSSVADRFSWCLMDESSRRCGDWSSEDFQPSIRLKDLATGSEEVRLIVTNAYGCSDTAIMQLPLKVESSEVKIKFPNAFTPNPSGPSGGSFQAGSGRIDVFHPVFIEVPVEYHLVVYSREGKIVFESREVYRGWDGYLNQSQAPSGVYVWMVEGRWEDGTPFSYRGDVTLVVPSGW